MIAPWLDKLYLVAEAGATTNGNVKTAKKLAETAHEAGFDAIKYQAVSPEILSDPTEPFVFQTRYGMRQQTMGEIYKMMHFSRKQLMEIADHCRRVGITFACTPDYLGAVDILEECGCEWYKICAWDVENEPLIAKIASTGKPVMVDWCWGEDDFVAFLKKIIHAAKSKKIPFIALHSFHTKDFHQFNMRAIRTMNSAEHMFGFSSPFREIDLDYIALDVGAGVIEKRISVTPESDEHHHFLSLQGFNEMKAWVDKLRERDKILGNYELKPSKADLEGKKKYFRSLAAMTDIKKGETFTEANMGPKRPGTGMHTKHYWNVLGQRAAHDIPKNKLLEQHDILWMA